MMKLILASQSPRRKELLGLLGIPFEIQVPQADETMDPNADPAQQVALVSRRKAMATQAEAGDVVIAADTIVVCDGEILGKPRSKEDACRKKFLRNDLQGQGYGALKNRGADCVIAALEPMQTEYKRLIADKAYLQGVLDENAKTASYLANKTLRKVQKKIGFASRG